MTLEQVTMGIESIYPLIERYRLYADSTSHEMSNARAGGAIPCSDMDIFYFVRDIINGEEKVRLTVSDIHWEESGGCVGDDLYPVTLIATKLPDGRYFMELEGFVLPTGEVPCRRACLYYKLGKLEFIYKLQ